MKKGLILLLSAVLLLGLWVSASAGTPYISRVQRVYFTANGSYYWAFIRDVTYRRIETKTSGFINSSGYLTFEQPNYGDIHVGYLYSWDWGRYIEAQAMRNMWLY